VGECVVTGACDCRRQGVLGQSLSLHFLHAVTQLQQHALLSSQAPGQGQDPSAIGPVSRASFVLYIDAGAGCCTSRRHRGKRPHVSSHRLKSVLDCVGFTKLP
jgi:hypothetical protein